MKIIILCLELSFALILLSCISNDYKREFKLIKSIIDQPNEIRSIIRDSDFYDSTLIDLDESYFFSLIKYFESKDNNYSFKSYVGPLNHKGIIYDNIKSIRVYDKESEYAIIFSFKEVDKKWKLLEIAFIKML
jgi:hypothetical protein